MNVSRRTFLGMTSTAAAGLAATPAAVAAEDDPLSCRGDFPVTRDAAYLNSPYITPSPQPVVDAVTGFYRAKAIDPIGLGDMLAVETRVRESFARLVNARPAEIGLLSTTSEGENVVTRALGFGPGDNVVIDDLHYDTSFALYDRLAETQGIEVRVVASVDGEATAERFATRVDAATRLLSVSWVSHQNGYRHDLKAFAELAHAHDAFLYADAIQGVGALPLDVRDCGVDFFTAGTYKWLLGGFGVAAFFVRDALLDRIDMDRVGWRQLDGPPVDGRYRYHEDARKYGYATPSFGAIYQLDAALDYLARIGVDRIARHSVALARELNASLRSLGVEVLTPEDNDSPIVAFAHGASQERAAAALDAAGVRASLREAGSQIRAGVALYNNRSDVQRLLEVAETLRGAA